MSRRRSLATSVALLTPLVLGVPATSLAHDGEAHLVAPADAAASNPAAPRHWLAGDHHIHSQYSVSYEPNPPGPPTALLGRDGRYPIYKNAEMARQFGLTWMVSTDHGGPNHSKINAEQAYPELQKSRAAVPQVLQFYGMEFDTPAGEHSSLIVPHTHGEREQLRDIESGYSRREAFPADPARDTEERMVAALKHMRGQATPPVLIANHPSRSAKGVAVYGAYEPHEFRNWNDAAPNVAVGMEGAPGHQAGALKPDGSNDPTGRRGGYRNSPTLGGFDQMTARLGGFWDSMLGEGRHWWITATSDSHRNWREDGNDFWPGEYSKTYVLARTGYDDIIDGIRNGRVFVTTGDLISELDVSVSSQGAKAGIGGSISVAPGQDVTVEIRVRDPAAPNQGGRTPEVTRVDLIVGDVTGPVANRDADRNPTTRVEHRFAAGEWTKAGEYLVMSHTLRNVRKDIYLRVRGTSTDELEPQTDPAGENPWGDLWFYANPVFVALKH